MQQYKDHIQRILNEGVATPGRDGVVHYDKPIEQWSGDSSISVFGAQLRFDLSKGLPFVTGKKLHLKVMAQELAWMLRGETNTKTLGNKIWDKWSLENPVITRKSLPEHIVVQQIVDLKLADTLEAGAEFLFHLHFKHAKYVGTPTENGEPPVINSFGDIEEYGQENFAFDYEKINQELADHNIQLYSDVERYSAGECGPIYGEQWRAFKFAQKDAEGKHTLQVIDQFTTLYENLANEHTKYTRKNYVSAWNPGLIPVLTASIKENISAGYQSLSPCHNGLHLIVKPDLVTKKDKLNTALHLLSSDTALGLPFNIGSYALIAGVFAAEFSLDLGDLVTSIDDAHIYVNQIKGLKEEYLNRPMHELAQFDRDAYEPMFKDSLKRIIEARLNDPESSIDEKAVDVFIKDIDNSIPGKRLNLFIMFLNHIQAEDLLKLVKGYTSEEHLAFELNR